MFRRQGLLYLSVSIVGIGLGIAVANLMSGIFPNILEQLVPVTSGVVLLMSLVIFMASYLPTRHAVALEPGDALRYE
jgi:putative ABC transport system permease protein